ncbi:penicillin-insensitive murein endopeptidase [Rhodobacteraceae bacterium NNCM2]|nr:penicillin-insensitive murein endopeptidase [Coraliihabitans acroporae]
MPACRLCLCLFVLIALPFELYAEQPAKQLFGRWNVPTAEPSAPYGSYAKGCLAGAEELAETGAAWQAMRLSRNRNWGHPEAIRFVERLGTRAQAIGWPRLYIGDISQPRGGPMVSGHRSHQIGLDIDIWLLKPTPKPLSRNQREKAGSPSVVTADKMGVNKYWTPSHHQVLKAAASDPAVARIFVNAAIKQQMCRDEGSENRAWLRKIRPWWSHDSHFHVRLFCPPDAEGCENQAAPPPGDGCDETLAWWFSDEALGKVPPKKPAKPAKPRRELVMADLPQACQAVIAQ